MNTAGTTQNVLTEKELYEISCRVTDSIGDLVMTDPDQVVPGCLEVKFTYGDVSSRVRLDLMDEDAREGVLKLMERMNDAVVEYNELFNEFRYYTEGVEDITKEVRLREREVLKRNREQEKARREAEKAAKAAKV